MTTLSHAAASGRMLLVNLGGIGDVVMALPAIEALCRTRADQAVDILLNSHAEQLLNHSPWINHAYYLASTRSKPDWLRNALRDRRVFRLLRAQRYGMLVNLHGIHSWPGEWRARVVLRNIRPGFSVGLSQKSWGRFYDQTVLLDRKQKTIHKGEQAMLLAERLGARRVVMQPHLCVSDVERKACAGLLNDLGVLRRQQLVLMNPSATGTKRRWPVDSMRTLAEWMHQHYGVRILLVGPENQSRLGAAIERRLPGVAVSLMGKTSLRTLMALIESAGLVVSNDGGIAHLAAALSTPLVCLYGDTDPDYIGPLGDQSRITVVKAGNGRIQDIEPAAVQQAVSGLMDHV